MNIPITQGRIYSPVTLALSTGDHPVPQWQRIEQACANAWEIPVQWLHTRRKCFHIAYPRMVAMTAMQQRLNWTVSRIAEHFDMDHGAILHGIARIDTLSQVDKSIRRMREAAERAM